MNDKDYKPNLEELFRFIILTEEHMDEIEKSGIITTKLTVNNSGSDYLILFLNNKINGSDAFLYKRINQNIYNQEIYRYQKI